MSYSGAEGAGAVTLTTSSKTAEHSLLVTEVVAPRAGEEFISSSQGRMSLVSMKSAPYSSKQFFLAQQPSIMSWMKGSLEEGQKTEERGRPAWRAGSRSGTSSYQGRLSGTRRWADRCHGGTWGEGGGGGEDKLTT